jgi:hypothetical protein
MIDESNEKQMVKIGDIEKRMDDMQKSFQAHKDDQSKQFKDMEKKIDILVEAISSLKHNAPQ